jgi:alpha-galactosidase
MAWQFDRPDLQEGLVQAFRRENCFYEGARLKLKGLESQGRYTVKNLDTNESQTISGQELMEKGLLVAISEIPGTAVITYKKMN